MCKKVAGVFCLNTKCKNYFEDNCMKLFENNTVHITADGRCEDFKSGRHIGYKVDDNLKLLNSLDIIDSDYGDSPYVLIDKNEDNIAILEQLGVDIKKYDYGENYLDILEIAIQEGLANYHSSKKGFEMR